MFEFNPDLVQGDDDEADDVVYEREDQDEEVRISIALADSEVDKQWPSFTVVEILYGDFYNLCHSCQEFS